jgi:hypothetical protein
MKPGIATLRIATVAALLAVAVPAQAVLQDRGPVNPATGYPTWYRDLNGTALQLCTSTGVSPTLGAAAPMCFPLAADPAGFPGNLGGEVFYSDSVITVAGQAGLSVKYLAALESAYANGTPIKGDEVVFARIRIVLATNFPGTYKITHPYGVETFTGVGTGPRSVFFTQDIGLAPGNFDLALTGALGPFLQSAGGIITAANGDRFLGDPNAPAPFTGSPFGNNFVRVDGPVGSAIGGPGVDFVIETGAAILGQLYTTAIPTPFAIQRATYSRDATGNNTVDVWVTSAPLQKILLTGGGMPSGAVLKEWTPGNYMAHFLYNSPAAPNGDVNVTNLTGAAPSTLSIALKDLVNVTAATYDSVTGALSVTATSSDVGASLIVVGVPGILPPTNAMTMVAGATVTTGTLSATLPALTALPPMKMRVESTAGGFDVDDVVVLNGAVAPPPVVTAVEDNSVTRPLDIPATIPSSAPFTVNVMTNDTTAVGFGVLIITPPTNGTVTVGAAGSVTYTPTAASFPATCTTLTPCPDSFQYVLYDGASGISNLATVSLNVILNAAAAGPTANPDNASALVNSPVTINVLANDTAFTGTTIDPASIAIVTLPAAGTAVANLNGTITYTAGPVAGTYTFSYTVKNTAGAVSNAAVVTVVVGSTTELITFQKVNYTVSKAKWTIVGTTNIFAPPLTPTMTCYVGLTTAGPLIGTVPVDTTGKFQLVPLVAPPPDATKAVTCQSSNGGVKSAPVILN